MPHIRRSPARHLTALAVTLTIVSTPAASASDPGGPITRGETWQRGIS